MEAFMKTIRKVDDIPIVDRVRVNLRGKDQPYVAIVEQKSNDDREFWYKKSMYQRNDCTDRN